MEKPFVRQLELYRDDSVVAVYDDGSKLLLSPCGASFLHVDSTSHTHPCPSKVQQSTQFAISKYRYKLQIALEFRNKFAEKPFLCDSIIKEQNEIRNTRVEVITWPLCRHCIKRTTNDTLVLHSVDNDACIELLPSGRLFTVTYWAAMNSRLYGETEPVGVVHHTLTQWYSVSDVPDVWACPLELLVTTARNNVTECCHDNKQVCSVLPGILPSMCRNVHMHHWEKPAAHPGLNDMLKIVYSDKVTYRLIWDKQCVEAYPDQDTVIKSCDPLGRYYDMWCPNQIGEASQYRMCYDQLPVALYKQFSMAAVIGRMSRLLQAMGGWNGEMSTHSVCWLANNEDIPTIPVDPQLVREDTNVIGIGRFMAYNSGRVYIAFVDNIVLEMWWPPQMTGHCNKIDRLPSGYCRLLLSNGQYQILPVLHTPQPYQRYIQYAVRWAEWAYCEHHQRNGSDTFTISDTGTEYHSMASNEVAKIRRILGTNDSDGNPGSSHTHSPNSTRQSANFDV